MLTLCARWSRVIASTPGTDEDGGGLPVRHPLLRDIVSYESSLTLSRLCHLLCHLPLFKLVASKTTAVVRTDPPITTPYTRPHRHPNTTLHTGAGLRQNDSGGGGGGREDRGGVLAARP